MWRIDNYGGQKWRNWGLLGGTCNNPTERGWWLRPMKGVE